MVMHQTHLHLKVLDHLNKAWNASPLVITAEQYAIMSRARIFHCIPLQPSIDLLSVCLISSATARWAVSNGASDE